MKLEQAYPDIKFRWRSRNWWARLTRVPPECEHLEHGGPWMATFLPDTLYVRGKALEHRRPARPEVSLCRVCLLSQLERELSEHRGRVIAFEPDGEIFPPGRPSRSPIAAGWARTLAAAAPGGP